MPHSHWQYSQSEFRERICRFSLISEDKLFLSNFPLSAIHRDFPFCLMNSHAFGWSTHCLSIHTEHRWQCGIFFQMVSYRWPSVNIGSLERNSIWRSQIGKLSSHVWLIWKSLLSICLWLFVSRDLGVREARRAWKERRENRYSFPFILQALTSRKSSAQIASNLRNCEARSTKRKMCCLALPLLGNHPCSWLWLCLKHNVHLSRRKVIQWRKHLDLRCQKKKTYA